MEIVFGLEYGFGPPWSHHHMEFGMSRPLIQIVVLFFLNYWGLAFADEPPSPRLKGMSCTQRSSEEVLFSLVSFGLGASLVWIVRRRPEVKSRKE